MYCSCLLIRNSPVLYVQERSMFVTVVEKNYLVAQNADSLTHSCWVGGGEISDFSKNF